MPVFGLVEVYPTSTWWGYPWVDHVDGDAFARVSRGICDLYSLTVRKAAIAHPVSLLRLFSYEEVQLPRGVADGGGTVVLSPLDPDPVREGFEAASVRVLAGFAAMALPDQQRLALDVVHSAAQGLAIHRGLPRAPFERARAAVVEAGYVFSWDGPWKASPTRRWRARCRFRTAPDGFGRLVLEIGGSGDGADVVRSVEKVTSQTMEGQHRAAATLTWTGPDQVQVRPSMDLSGVGSGLLAVDISQPDARQVVHRAQDGIFTRGAGEADAEDVPPTAVDARAHAPRSSSVQLVMPDPDRREVVGVGGGSAEGVPPAYEDAMSAYFSQFEGEQWHRWWSAAALPELQVSYWTYDIAQERLFVRRSRTKVIARVERRPSSFSGSDDEARRLAREDLEGLLAIVARRMDLEQPPPLQDR